MICMIYMYAGMYGLMRVYMFFACMYRYKILLGNHIWRMTSCCIHLHLFVCWMQACMHSSYIICEPSYLCMYECMYTCICTYVCSCIFPWAWTCIWYNEIWAPNRILFFFQHKAHFVWEKNASGSIHAHEPTCLCKFKDIRMFIFVYTHTYTHTYLYIHAYIHTYIHTCICICTESSLSVSPLHLEGLAMNPHRIICTHILHTYTMNHMYVYTAHIHYESHVRTYCTHTLWIQIASYVHTYAYIH